MAISGAVLLDRSGGLTALFFAVSPQRRATLCVIENSLRTPTRGRLQINLLHLTILLLFVL